MNGQIAPAQPANPLIQWAAILFAAAYFGLVVFLALNKTDAAVLSEQWTRILHLLAGPEAIVFAGSGFLFGREVNRQRAEGAEKRAEGAEQRAQGADTKAQDAKEQAAASEAKGKVLKAAILSKSQSVQGLESDAGPRANQHLQELAAIATNLYQ